MATIDKRGDGWRAQVRRKGLSPKTKTFPVKAMAIDWAARIEREYAQREARGEAPPSDMTLREAIKWYEKEVGKTAKWGRSKAADLRRLASYDIAGEPLLSITTRDYIRHGEARNEMGAGPPTVLNDFIWLRQVLKSVRASKDIKVDLALLDDAVHALRQRKILGKPTSRDRRITADEERLLLAHFDQRDSTIPMGAIMRFALVTARRQEEITRLRWADLNEPTGTAWLDDVKHPTKKVGNRKQFRMLRDAWTIINAQARQSDIVFPYNHRTVSSYFTQACHLLEIEDLTFHDLRHEATSRLFERGYSIQEVAQFTLHESWATLKRYTHLKPAMVPER